MIKKTNKSVNITVTWETVGREFIYQILTGYVPKLIPAHLRDYHLKCSGYHGKFDGKFIMCIYIFISFPHILKFILYQSLVMFGESGRKLNCG